MTKNPQIRRRIAPTVPLTLTLANEDGSTQTKKFKLSFDFNAVTRAEELTGFGLLSGEIWKHATAKTLSILFWSAICANHPEYDYDPEVDDEEKDAAGLYAIRSYMDAGNAAEITQALSDAFILSLPEKDRARIKAAQDKARKNADPTPPATTEEPAPEANVDEPVASAKAMAAE